MMKILRYAASWKGDGVLRSARRYLVTSKAFSAGRIAEPGRQARCDSRLDLTTMPD